MILAGHLDDQEEVPDFTSCMFCGDHDSKWNEDALDLHYWKVQCMCMCVCVWWEYFLVLNAHQMFSYVILILMYCAFHPFFLTSYIPPNLLLLHHHHLPLPHSHPSITQWHTQDCALLAPCPACAQVVEVAGMPEHLLDECDQKDLYVSCDVTGKILSFYKYMLICVS